MLVLSRKLGEQINIGSNIVVTIVRVQGEKVRIGINAPKNIEIVRDELISPEQLKKFTLVYLTNNELLQKNIFLLLWYFNKSFEKGLLCLK